MTMSLLPPGGGLVIAVDIQGLAQFADLNPDLDTLDEILEELVRAAIILQTIAQRCEIEASVTSSGNIGT